MLEELVVMLFNRGLSILGLAHDKLADHHIDDAKHDQHQRHAHIHGHGHRNERCQCHHGRQVLAHEFEPEGEEESVARISVCSALEVPRF